MNVRTNGTSFPIPVWLIVVLVAVPVVVTLLVVLQKWLTRKMETQVAAGPKQTPAGCLTAFAGLFVVAGLASFFFITVRPTYRSMQAARWPTTQGTVISSRLGESSSDKGGRTYRVDIRYRYDVAGHTYESNQYDGTGTSTYSGWRDQKQAAVAAHRPGKPVTVYYDPADPADAMLSTVVPPGTFAFVWFPIVFCTVPVGICYAIYRGQKNMGKPNAARPVKVAPTAADARGKRRRNFIALLVFALLWNGFITFFWLMTRTWFVVPFVIVGLILAVAAGHLWLAMFNPLAGVSFAHMPVHPGEPCDVAFVFSGNVMNVRSLAFTLEGREQVTYAQGSSSRTETKVVYVFPLMETTKAFEMERGRFVIKLPVDVMTSFVSRHNAFSWHLVCRGDIPRRPKMKDEFDVTVLVPARR